MYADSRWSAEAEQSTRFTIATKTWQLRLPLCSIQQMINDDKWSCWINFIVVVLQCSASRRNETMFASSDLLWQWAQIIIKNIYTIYILYTSIRNIPSISFNRSPAVPQTPAVVGGICMVMVSIIIGLWQLQSFDMVWHGVTSGSILFPLKSSSRDGYEGSFLVSHCFCARWRLLRRVSAILNVLQCRRQWEHLRRSSPSWSNGWCFPPQRVWPCHLVRWVDRMSCKEFKHLQ